MTEYKQYSVNLSPSQSQKLVKAIEMKAPVTLRLKSVDLTGSDTIFLTSTQINKIKKAKSLNKGVDIDFSKTQISNIRSKIGSGIEIDETCQRHNHIVYHIEHRGLYLHKIEQVWDYVTDPSHLTTMILRNINLLHHL